MRSLKRTLLKLAARDYGDAPLGCVGNLRRRGAIVGPDGAALIERLNLLAALQATTLDRCGSPVRPGDREGQALDPLLQAEFECAILHQEETK